ncbi:MAG: HIT domain-containing protein [Chloroflexota bacterium]|nr:HIT domain-containing protein [Chloroflexota bacterium]
MEYIKRDRELDGDCLFCALASCAEGDGGELVVFRSSHAYVALNKYPYSYGHVMIVPYAHVPSQEDMDMEALGDLILLTNQSMRALRQLAHPSGFNIGANIGAAAGAGIAAHYHFHVVPRWEGDANFMTSVANTRLIPDTLDNLAQALKQIWNASFKDGGAQ